MNNNEFAFLGVEDLIPIIAISPNTDFNRVRPHIIEAQILDLVSIFGETFYSDLKVKVKANYKQYQQGKTYSINDIVFYEEAYYKALASTSSTPNSTDWQVNELLTFYHLYVKIFLACATVTKYLPFMDLHQTQWGLEQYNQEGFGQVSDKRRAELVNNIKSKMEVYKTRMLNYFEKVDGTFDGVKYEVTCSANKNRRLSFTIIGKSRGFRI